MVIMTEASPSKAEETGETSAYFVLDETGDTNVDSSVLQFERLQPDCEVREVAEEPGVASQGPRIAIQEQQSEGHEEGELEATSEEESEGNFETVDENLGQSSSDGSPMRNRLMSRSSRGGAQGSPANSRRRGNKRKRRQTFSTPVIPKKTKPSPGTPGKVTKKKKRRNKKKSVIVIGDSDSEQEKTSPPLPDISVVEIDDDESSVIVLSDDEVGVCSGTLSTMKKPLQPRNVVETVPPKVSQLPAGHAKSQAVKPPSASTKQQPLVVEDLTGNYISKKQEEPQEKNYFELYRPESDNTKKTGLRPIVIDGCNVAFGHGRDRFSSLGLKICVDYFKKMGHEVRAFVPQFRKTHSGTMDPQLLDALEKDGTLSFTPSRRTDGKMIVSYDDRFIVQYADATGGIIVSRDNYRDLLNENPEYKETIHKRLLMFTWVGDTIMFPKDPLGRGGPTLQEFLRF